VSEGWPGWLLTQAAGGPKAGKRTGNPCGPIDGLCEWARKTVSDNALNARLICHAERGLRVERGDQIETH
jgi:hypothetical protein